MIKKVVQTNVLVVNGSLEYFRRVGLLKLFAGHKAVIRTVLGTNMSFT